MPHLQQGLIQPEAGNGVLQGLIQRNLDRAQLLCYRRRQRCLVDCAVCACHGMDLN